MGSFDYTCAVSGLPIRVGMKVRYMLLTQNPYAENSANRACGIDDWWFPRTFPLRAEYNDYGSVQKIEGGVPRSLWMEALATDVVEQGWGDNSCHDVPTSASMTFEALLDAIREGRVRVKQNIGSRSLPQSWEPPKGVPTLKRVQEQLTAAADLKLYAGSFGESSFLVDDVEYGLVRVRWHGAGDTLGKDAEFLTTAAAHLADYVTMIRAGSGSYAHAAELLVAVKSGTEGFHGGPSKHDESPLLVSHAMIREDVWQALLQIGIQSDWGPKFAIENYYEDIKRHYQKCLDAIGDKAFWTVTLRSLGSDTAATAMVLQDIPFMVGPAFHWIRFIEKRLPARKARDFLRSVAELSYIQRALYLVRYMWRPSSIAGPQFGAHKNHVAFLKALTRVSVEAKKKERNE